MGGIEAVSTACHHYDNGPCIEASRRRLGGSAWSRHWFNSNCLSFLRQCAAHRIIVPLGRRQRTEISEMEGTACHRY